MLQTEGRVSPSVQLLLEMGGFWAADSTWTQILHIWVRFKAWGSPLALSLLSCDPWWMWGRGVSPACHGLWWEGSLLRLRANFLTSVLGITFWQSAASLVFPIIVLMKTTLSWTIIAFLLNWPQKQWSIDSALSILTCSDVVCAGGKQEWCQHEFGQRLINTRDCLLLAPLPRSVFFTVHCCFSPIPLWGYRGAAETRILPSRVDLVVAAEVWNPACCLSHGSSHRVPWPHT